ncbi:MAG: cupredoxin domain-containing protein [Acidimicrobiales bacterium]
MNNKLLVAALAALGTLLAACGSGSSTATNSGGSASSKDVAIEMRDIAYSPTTLSVKKGATIMFTFHNAGAIVHEALIGDDAAQQAHAKQMASSSSEPAGSGASTDGSMGGMGHDSSSAASGMHDASSSDFVTVDPGDSATLSHTFDSGGTFIIGCHEPGHYEAGMKVTVTVS